MYLEGVRRGWRGLGECVFFGNSRFMNLLLNDVLGFKQMNLEGQNEWKLSFCHWNCILSSFIVSASYGLLVKVLLNKHESEYLMASDWRPTISIFNIHSLRFLGNVIPEVKATYRLLVKAWWCCGLETNRLSPRVQLFLLKIARILIQISFLRCFTAFNSFFLQSYLIIFPLISWKKSKKKVFQYSSYNEFHYQKEQIMIYFGLCASFATRLEVQGVHCAQGTFMIYMHW